MKMADSEEILEECYIADIGQVICPAAHAPAAAIHGGGPSCFLLLHFPRLSLPHACHFPWQALLRCAKTVLMPHNGQPTQVRVGIHTGSVVTGLIGTKLPKFSIFGDTMNTASRMESTCHPGCIQVSLAARELLGEYTFTPTGGIEVKGKGLMETFLWDPEEHPEEQYVSAREQAREQAGILAHISSKLPTMPTSDVLAEAYRSYSSKDNSKRLPDLIRSRDSPDFGAMMAVLAHTAGCCPPGRLTEAISFPHPLTQADSVSAMFFINALFNQQQQQQQQQQHQQQQQQQHQQQQQQHQHQQQQATTTTTNNNNNSTNNNK